MILAERVPQLPKMNELYKELETDRNQGLKMLYALQRGGLLLLLGDDVKSPDNLSRPDKIYINNPTMMYALTPKVDTGTLRETFFCNQLSQGHEVRYPKRVISLSIENICLRSVVKARPLIRERISLIVTWQLIILRLVIGTASHYGCLDYCIEYSPPSYRASFPLFIGISATL